MSDVVICLAALKTVHATRFFYQVSRYSEWSENLLLM